MKNFESYKGENIESKTPEKIVDGGVAAVEAKEKGDSIVSSEWIKAAKEVGKGAAFTVGFLLVISYKITEAILKFTKESIQKKGNVGFKQGYEIGREMFTLGNDKDKKGKK